MDEKQKEIAQLYDEIEEAREKYYQLLSLQTKELHKLDPESYRNENIEATADYLDVIENNRTRKATPTGFNNLDQLLDGGLYDGLYVIGAISSLGKTSFALHIANTIAESGTDVLYISFEMSAFELYSRAISRLLLKQDQRLTTREILTGSVLDNQDIRKAYIEAHKQYYDKIAPNLFIIQEELGKSNVMDIAKRIKYHIRITGNRPVVMIDYLQILTPIDERATDKQNMDKAIVQLKQLSRDHQLSIIAISSLNRSSYKNRISFEAFKESGSIEYSSDVVIGLQLDNQGKISGTNEEEKSRNFEELMSRDKKDIELIILKNRTGRRGSICFDYNCKYNQWKERT